MFNKNFFLGVLTTLLVVGILAIGGLFAFRANSGMMTGGRPDRLEQRSDQPAPPGNLEGRGQANPGDNRFEDRGQRGQANPGDNRFEGDRDGFSRGERGHGHTSFSPLRGLGGILGSLLLIGLIIGAVVGGQKLFKRFRRPNAPSPAAGVDTPLAPLNAPDEPLAAASPEPAELEELPADESPVTETPEPVDEPPAETPESESPAEASSQPPVSANN